MGQPCEFYLVVDWAGTARRSSGGSSWCFDRLHRRRGRLRPALVSEGGGQRPLLRPKLGVAPADPEPARGAAGAQGEAAACPARALQLVHERLHPLVQLRLVGLGAL